MLDCFAASTAGGTFNIYDGRIVFVFFRFDVGTFEYGQGQLHFKLQNIEPDFASSRYIS